MRVYQIVVVGLLMVGIVGSIKDWRDWKYQETYRYGYGWEADRELAAAQKLAGPYQNNVAKIRMRYPEGWDVQETQVVTFTSPFTLNSEGKKSSIAVFVGRSDQNLPDLVSAEVQKVGKLSKEWEYVNGEKMGFTVITWEGGSWVYQKAMGVADGRLVTIDVSCEKAMWNTFAKTFVEVYKSVVLF